MLFEGMEPYGERGAWLRMGILCATLVNLNRGKDDTPASPEDFMPETMTERPRPQSEADRHLMDIFAGKFGMTPQRKG